MNPSAAPALSGELEGRYRKSALVESDPEAAEQLVACVLRRARVTAETLGEASEARAILHLAHSFADELAAANPHFDRLRFIENATADPS